MLNSNSIRCLICLFPVFVVACSLSCACDAATPNVVHVEANMVPADFVTTSTNSVHWGDSLLLGKDIEREDWFRVWSHNVNGLSCRRDSTDLQDFTNTMRDKGVSLLGIQETNRNFEKQSW
jgi:hypothetical protein